MQEAEIIIIAFFLPLFCMYSAVLILTKGGWVYIIVLVDYEVVCMKLNIRELEGNLTGKMDFLLSEVLKPLLFKGDTLEFEGPVKVKGEVKKVDDSYLVSGKVKAVFIMQCSRCLSDFPHEIRTSFNQRFKREPDQEDAMGLKGDIIDLESIVLESLILEIPIKPLCSEACRGLCPVCGKDRNIEECECRREMVDPRLASLKEFFESQND